MTTVIRGALRRASRRTVRFQRWPLRALNTVSSPEAWGDDVQVFRLIMAFRRRGHLVAKLDPLRGSLHRQLSPLEPIGWRIGGVHGTDVHDIDVVRLLRDYPELDLSACGITNRHADDLLPEGFAVPRNWGTLPSGHEWTYRRVIEHLRRSYSSTISIEHQHIENSSQRHWLTDRMEERPVLEVPAEQEAEQRRRALRRLVEADQLERLLREKYASTKRFGIEGCEALLPALWALLERSSDLGVEHVLLGMAHRGRLNVLVNFMGKKVSTVCCEFGERVDFLGDVKYHLGTTSKRIIEGRQVDLTLLPNPSHLEMVNPVVLGLTRAKQDYARDTSRHRHLPVLLHGDAAFSGQGIIAECMQLADLPAYTTGGTIHIVINNLVGFTTDPRFARSSYHCTSVAKVNDAPIIHVNADDVDAVLFASNLAAEFRHTFRKDIVLDLVSYRRYGHNEVDEPSLTQPLTRAAVERHEPVLEIYSQKLLDDGIIHPEELEAQIEQVYTDFEAEYHYAAGYRSVESDWQVKDWKSRPVNVTGLPVGRLTQIGKACFQFPDDFVAHKVIEKVFHARLRQLRDGRVDWALAEHLAIGSLLLNFDPEHPLTTGLIDGRQEGLDQQEVDDYVIHPPCPVRMSGQDVERGTFNQRHAIIHDQRTAMPYCPLNHMKLGSQSEANISNSSLSELAVLGFEYGYSLETGMALTIWEAQFGDFANCAQPLIDNFIASGECKWGSQSCLVMMLPHGYEGQGPEHSSARLERFLQLVDDDPDAPWPKPKTEDPCALGDHSATLVQEALVALRSPAAPAATLAMRRVDLQQEGFDSIYNIAVVNVTTPANLFHVLRRQIHRTFAKPLVLMSAKYLLHHRPCRSPLTHMSEGTRFQRLIVEGGPGDNMLSESGNRQVRRLIFCSGKVFYELFHARAAKNLLGDIALARLEQIAPFPAMHVAVCVSQYPGAEIVWVQEEPKNMGAWTYVAPRFAAAFRDLIPEATMPPRKMRYVGRPPAATPATALFKHHKEEVRAILQEAMSLNNNAV